MTLTEEYSLTEHQVLARLGSSAIFAEDTVFEVRSVFRKKDEGKWKLWGCSIEKTEAGKKVWSEEYKENAFFISYMSYKVVKSILQNLYKDGIAVQDKYPNIILDTQFPPRWKEILIPSFFSKDKVPRRHYILELSTQNYNDEKLVGYNLPYYSSFNERANEFLNHKYGSNNCIHLVIEDKRAILNTNNNSVKLISDLEISVVGEVMIGEEIIKAGADGKKLNDIKITEADSIELWAIDSNDLIFDYISTTSFPYKYELVSKNLSEAEYIQEKIENGETIDCEFKKYIDLGRGDNKSEDIDKTACAFSNTNGGCLIIGVSDNGEIIGISEEVRKTYRVSLDEAINEYRKDINKRLYENLTNNECFSTCKIELHGKQLIIITVEKVDKWNFVQHTDVPYKRKGSTNFNATRLVALSYESNVVAPMRFK